MGFGRVKLYHQTCPEGRIFTDESEHDIAVMEGWVDAPYPWLLGLEDLPDAKKLKAMGLEVPEGEVEKAVEPPRKNTDSPPDAPLLPWQKAQLVRKRKAEERRRKKNQ